MTKNITELDQEEENSLISNESSSSNEFVIRDTIIEEEERLVIENEKVINEEQAQSALVKEEKENDETEEDLAKKIEAEIREKRYKRLIHLLKNSKMYAVILRNRMEDEVSKGKKQSNTTQGSEEVTLKKKKSHTQYKVHEVLTEKHIEENIKDDKDKNPESELSETDYFSKTRVTNLGFTVSHKQPVLLEGATMRDYQLKGLEWMINLFLNGVNGILADEMGLGKTIQVISFICYLIEQNIKGPFLIVAPLSTISNWMMEFKRFAPKVPIILYHGVEAERMELLPKILETTEIGQRSVHKVVITSYQIPLKDSARLGKINWYYLIIDEGHRIKNYNSMLSKKLKEYNTIGRLLLTGTPLQNDLSELWSLLNFLLPEVFSSLDVFESWFDIRDLEKNGMKFMQEKFNINVVNILQEILIPFVLRREKKDVNLQLPPKKEILIYCPMTKRQKELYEATLDRSIEFLAKPKEEEFDLTEPLPKRRCFLYSPYGRQTKNQVKPKRSKAESSTKDTEDFITNVVLGNPQMQLRKIANHPYLVQFPLVNGTEELRIDEDLVKQSGKLLVLDAMLAKLEKRGHKVVLFSCFKTVLDILVEYVTMRGYNYCRFDGSYKITDRDDEISRFVSDPNVFIFLMTIRAGGLGINLTTADTVIIFDSDWNPQVNLQAQDRCHRIGQTKPVVVYSLCSVGTIDEKIIQRGNAKRRLEKMIFKKGMYVNNPTDQKKLLNLQELKQLFESSDRSAIDVSNPRVFTDKQLDALLDRSDMTNESSSPQKSENKFFKVYNTKDNLEFCVTSR